MILYKYLPPPRVDVLENQRIRLTQLSDLNDPAESVPRFESTAIPWKEFKAQVEYLFPIVKPRQGCNTLSESLDTLTTAERRALQRGMLMSVLDYGTVVLSLSASRTSETMWAHYADSHRGFVAGFDSRHRFFAQRETHLRPVHYVRKIATFRYLEELDLKGLLFIKSSSWSYEREWRLVKTIVETRRFLRNQLPIAPSGNDLWLERFPAATLYSVTLGCRIDGALRQRIYSALGKPRFRHVRIYQTAIGRAGRLSFRASRQDGAQSVVSAN